ncbi:hypothetical protein DPMN_017188 [Dreissena polymorpha]|uniref:Uncharacterized protein n=2 Tax=Dreissena polymorpha TaxID=45954 RepID=A0A9D4NG05_DREPO|nr:hypothetical protein DPMN_017188 [Dreissena polymorpha]
MKGGDFNVYYKSRQKMWRRPIIELTEEERDNHLFRLPDDPKRYPVLPELGTRSLTQPQMTTVTAEPARTEKPSQLTVPSSFNDPTLCMTSEPKGLISNQVTNMGPSLLTPQRTLQPVS